MANFYVNKRLGQLGALLFVSTMTWMNCLSPAQEVTLHVVTLVGKAHWGGTASDRTGLKETLNGVPHDRLGGFSGIDYLGTGDRYAVLPDRGPQDGAVPYKCRVQIVKIEIDPAATSPVRLDLEQSILLGNEVGQSFVGALAAFDDQHPDRSLRLDPEAIRAVGSDSFLVSDEYGPHVLRFDRSGHCQQRLAIPARFQIAHPAATPQQESLSNEQGRQSNGGFEGLALTPNHTTALAILQRPLIQDSEPSADGKRLGTNVRLLRIDLASKATREFVYPLENAKCGVSEIVAIDEQSALVLERDSAAGELARFKRIYRIDWSRASDVSDVPRLPAGKFPAELRPVHKELLLDLLEPRCGLVGPECPEKVEGLTFGPLLPDGRISLLVTVDNDFQEKQESTILVFTVPPARLPGYGRVATR